MPRRHPSDSVPCEKRPQTAAVIDLHMRPHGRRWCERDDFLFFFKQKTAYEILRSDWSSDVCSSDRSEEHSSELQSLRRISYAVFCLTGDQTCALPIRSEEHTSELQSLRRISYT